MHACAVAIGHWPLHSTYSTYCIPLHSIVHSTPLSTPLHSIPLATPLSTPLHLFHSTPLHLFHSTVHLFHSTGHSSPRISLHSTVHLFHSTPLTYLFHSTRLPLFTLIYWSGVQWSGLAERPLAHSLTHSRTISPVINEPYSYIRVPMPMLQRAARVSLKWTMR